MSDTPRIAELTRRQFTLSALGVLGAGALAACPSGADDDDDGAEIGPAGAGVPWATGGTAAMAAEYADPFSEAGPICALTCATTLGPCYAETFDRRDVSEGVSGLPTRLALRVLDADCQVVPDAIVDIWHCAPNGLYSGPDAAAMCTANDAQARAGSWFRGTQRSDADGRVDFNTCLPGWYSGRALHVHVQVRRGGVEYVTSQFFFPESLIADVFANHPDYEPTGMPDTPNNSDSVLDALDEPDSYLTAARKMEDGALQAWWTVVLRSEIDEELCGS